MNNLRQVIKALYIFMTKFLNILFSKKKVKQQSIVILMTFPEDMLPIIEGLNRKGDYQITVIGKDVHRKYTQHLEHVTYVLAGNKQLYKHLKYLSTAKVIIIDTYYLLMGGFLKKEGQTVIQTWHAAGALKNFGLTDHQVDLNNNKMVEQYRQVYNATDKYIVGGEPMVTCFKESFGAADAQMLRTGLPRLVPYRSVDITQRQRELKKQYDIKGKVALYVPTYREHHQANRTIDKHKFETALPNYTLFSKLHPSIVNEQHTEINLQSLIIMADIIISDYSSLAIEASLLNKPTLLYVYDEQQYETERGLNTFYYEIPDMYKVYNEGELIQNIKKYESDLQPLFKSWHEYNVTQSLTKVIETIEEMVKV